MEGLGVLETSLLLWKRCRREGGGGGGYRDDLAGEAARDEASEDATMALARESTSLLMELTETVEADLRRRSGARMGTLKSEADAKESSDDAFSSSISAGSLEAMAIECVATVELRRGA